MRILQVADPYLPDSTRGLEAHVEWPTLDGGDFSIHPATRELESS